MESMPLSITFIAMVFLGAFVGVTIHYFLFSKDREINDIFIRLREIEDEFAHHRINPHEYSRVKGQLFKSVMLLGREVAKLRGKKRIRKPRNLKLPRMRMPRVRTPRARRTEDNTHEG